jgi:predicted DNA-binding WGR domain protein
MNAVQLDLIDLIEAGWPRPVYLRRIDPALNMRRFYALAIEQDLFGTLCLITEYGRIGRNGRVLSRHCLTEREALDLFDRARRQKERRGYRSPRDFINGRSSREALSET